MPELEEQGEAASQRKRTRGRPRRADGPAFPREELDRLLVHGEASQTKDGASQVRHPSYRELGERFKVATSLVARYAKEYDCLKRRKLAREKLRRRVDAETAEAFGDRIMELYKDGLRSVELWVKGNLQCHAEGKVRCDDMANLKLVLMFGDAFRARLGPAAMVTEGMPSLEELQRDYEKQRAIEALAEKMRNPEKSGGRSVN